MAPGLPRLQSVIYLVRAELQARGALTRGGKGAQGVVRGLVLGLLPVQGPGAAGEAFLARAAASTTAAAHFPVSF